MHPFADDDDALGILLVKQSKNDIIVELMSQLWLAELFRGISLLQSERAACLLHLFL
jgi:hypothetical protein